MDIIFGFLCGAILLFLPGYLISALSKLPHTLRLACAPAISVGFYCVCATIYSMIGIPCTWVTLFTPFILVGLIATVVAAIAWRRMSKATDTAKADHSVDAPSSAKHSITSASCDTTNTASSADTSQTYPSSDKHPGFVLRAMDSKSSWLIFAAYLVCGLLLTSIVFLGNLDGLYEFSQRYDNVFHLGLIRTFIDTDVWSIFGTSIYAGATDFQAPVNDVKFYPSAWHMICAMIVQITSVPVAYSENITNMLFVSLVFSSGMFALMSLLFPHNRTAVAFGIIVSFAFAAFPWKLMSWGPIFPNLAALCSLPAVMAAFMTLIGEGASKRQRIWAAAIFVMGSVGVALLQPNGIFTMAIFLAAYCFHRIGQTKPLKVGGKSISPHILQALFLVLVIAVWLGAYKVPFIHEIASFIWPAFSGKAEALRNIALLSLRETNPQVILGIVVIAGFILTLIDKEKRWLVAPYLFMCIAYFFAATTEGRVKQILSGFWYTDPIRLGANIALFAMPLASYALAKAYDALRKLIAKKESSASGKPRHAFISAALSGAFIIVFALTVFYPGIDLEGKGIRASALGGVTQATIDCYRNGSPEEGNDNVYDEDEREFVQEVLNTVEPDDLILNEPNDGSGFLYGIEGMNTFYRYMYEYGRDNETEESRLIREQLDEIGSNEDVAEAVRSVGADYVLILDQGDNYEHSKHLWSYEEPYWTGFDSLTDDTPGLELVLSEGDMRLYKIMK